MFPRFLVPLTRYSPVTLSVFVFVLALLTFFWRLGEGPIYRTMEGREALVMQEIARTGNWILPLRNGETIPSKPPLLHWTGVLFARLTEFQELEHWGAQVKFGDISGGARSEIDGMLGQIDDAFKMPFYDLYTRQQQRISKLAIIISGRFTENAIEKICEKIESHAIRNNIVFIDGEKIQTLAERFATRSGPRPAL